MEYGIEVSHLWKSYHHVPAVADISFQVKQGEIFAFLGPNGAGKSTTISILCTLCGFDQGKIVIEGYERPQQDAAICNLLGVVFQGSMLDGDLSVKENLIYRCGLYGMYGTQAQQRVKEVVNQCHLETIQKQKVKELSGGQRRSVDIARALIPNPSLLILDEPSTGLDPKVRKELWHTIKEIHDERDMTIFMTTHYMEEAEIADHISILQKGKIILDGKKDALAERYQRDHLRLYSHSRKPLMKELQQHRIPYSEKGEYLCVDVDTFFQLMSILRHTERYIHRIELVKGSMEELYLQALRGEL